jgi:hypothetical protein
MSAQDRQSAIQARMLHHTTLELQDLDTLNDPR